MPILTNVSETFTGNATISGTATIRVGAFEYFLVGGGGAGGNAPGSNGNANGGAGGARTSNTFTLAATTSFGVTIGGGGAIGGQNSTGGAGGTTTLAGVGSAGGGGGGSPTGGNGGGANGTNDSTITGINYNFGAGGGDGRSGNLSQFQGGSSGGGDGAAIGGNVANFNNSSAGAANSGGGGGGGADSGSRHVNPSAGGSGVAFIQYYGPTTATTGGSSVYENTVNAGTDTTRRFNSNSTLGITTAAANQIAIFSGDISGGALTKTGLGTLVLAGTNSYTNTTISTATLQIGNGGASGTLGSGTVSIASGASLIFDRNNTYTLAAGNTLSGAGAVTQAGSGTTQLNNLANTYTGATTISAGVLEATKLDNGGSSSSIGSAAVAAGNLVLDGGTLKYSGTGASNGTSNRLFTLGTGATAGTLDASGDSGSPMIFNGAGSVAFSGAGTRTLTLTGSNTDDNELALDLGDNGGATSLTKSGDGKWILSNANTYTGDTVVQGGTLQLDAGGKVSNTSSITVGNSSGNGTLLVTTTGPHQLGTGEVVLGSTGGSIGTFNLQATGGTVSLVDSLVVGDAGVGIVNHASGVLNIGNGDATDGIGDLILGRSAGAASSSYDLAGGSVTADNVYIGQSGGTLGSPHLMSVGPGTTLTARRDLVVGAGGYGRLTQNGGTVNVQGVPTAIIGDGSTGTYDLDGGGLLAIAGNAEVGTNGGNGTMNHNDGTVTVGQNLTVGDAGSTGVYNLANNAANSLTVTGSEFIGVSDGIGTFTQSGGTHVLNGASSNLTIGASGQFNLAGGTLDFRDYVGAGAAWTPNNASTLSMNNGNDFLFTGGSLVDVSSIVTNGTTFTQTGGEFIIGRDGFGPAALTVIDRDYVLSGNGALRLDAFGVDSSPEQCCDGAASLNDQLTVLGDATLDSVVNIDFVGFTPEFGDVFTLLCANSIALGDNFALTGGYFRVVPTGLGPGQPQYALQAIVPEPASVAVWSLMALVGAAGLCRRRKRQRS